MPSVNMPKTTSLANVVVLAVVDWLVTADALQFVPLTSNGVVVFAFWYCATPIRRKLTADEKVAVTTLAAFPVMLWASQISSPCAKQAGL